MPFIKDLEKTLETEFPEPILTLVKPKIIETTLLTKLEKIGLKFLIELYDGTYIIKNEVIYLHINKDTFYFNLTDLKRFNLITVFHKNTAQKSGYHVQIKARSILYALFICFTHKFNIENNISNKPEDFIRFKKDCLNIYASLAQRN